MADGDAIVRCDHCEQPGRRRRGHPCPDHWFYLESLDRTEGSKRKGRIYVVWACSEECRDALWNPGPGPRVIEEAPAS